MEVTKPLAHTILPSQPRCATSLCSPCKGQRFSDSSEESSPYQTLVQHRYLNSVWSREKKPSYLLDYDIIMNFYQLLKVGLKKYLKLFFWPSFWSFIGLSQNTEEWNIKYLGLIFPLGTCVEHSQHTQNRAWKSNVRIQPRASPQLQCKCSSQHFQYTWWHYFSFLL